MIFFFFPHFVVESNTSTSTQMSGNVRDINYIFSSDKHGLPSILISLVPDLSVRQLTVFFGRSLGGKNGTICDILPRCNEVVFYEMSWEEVTEERAPPTQVNSPALWAQGNNLICGESDLPG